MSEQATPAPTRAGAIIGMALTFIGGYFLGVFTSGREASMGDAATVKRVQVPVGLSPSLGPDDAPVTIVQFADFQCGYCGRAVPLQKRILAELGGQVRWVNKQFPLDSHPRAREAARAALAAHAQGRFWEYHDRLFAGRTQLATEELVAFARELGLDAARFRQELGSEALGRLVDEDLEVGRKAGVQGTPTFFINGRKIEGAPSFSELERMIRDEIAYAGSLLRRGVPRGRLYEELTRPPAAPPAGPTPATGAPAGAGAGAARPQPPQKLATASARLDAIYRVPIGDGPALGGADALVTVVLYGDLQCEKTASVVGSLTQLRRELGERLRVVWKQFPLRRHPHARLAAQASLAAHAQGKFWSFAGRLLAARDDLSQPALLRLAGEEGLEVARVRADLAAGRFAKDVERDEDEAVRFGSIGTPTLFINGRAVHGARPLDELRRVILEEQERAKAALGAGVPRPQLYQHLTEKGAPRAEPPRAGAQAG